jgi:MYXO-CTERM domain-containing protein
LRSLRSRTGITLFVAAAGLLTATDSQAVWPPKESFTSEDMAKPENWPNDPGYSYLDGGDGQWEYYSFVPTQKGDLTLRPDEKASGMSIDLAWRFTRGDDRVVIAVTDSGIRWSEKDLLDRAWLNRVELDTHRPLTANGTPCGGSGDLAGFDCNSDGIFSVSDYASSPNLSPEPTDGRPLGDKNRNGVLDAGDLILNFSDGIDDDKNGYVDDISGWDFMKDDNDPFDDTDYGHGTGEARDSVSTANNGMGTAGGCQECRYMPMRVGDSFIADVNAFAQAVVYATDNGARVVQSALGTINMNNFTQAALDYAYANGVLTIASMADENARHHNMPTTANHTLPVHAIQYAPDDDITNVETFLDFNTCTNYGGQNLLSASSRSCSSGAVGQLSGISGLLMSASLKYELNPPLTPGEAQQLLITTADDIDVPESREPGAKWYWSQPGFDQRFGYGRVNANTAVEHVKDGKIPPEIDMVRPYWFEVLYKDQVTGPIDIKATVSAKRATSYDYVVEWAPGVHPLDGDFKQIASATNIPGSEISGADGSLASFDIRSVDTTHAPDSDSPNGENRYTITVRIRATARYGGDRGDVVGVMHRTYYVHSDPDLVKGFPVYLGDSGEGSPKLADLDGDGVRDIVYPTSGGKIHALRITANGPEPLPGFPFTADRVDGLAASPIAGKPSYLDGKAYKEKLVDPALGGDSFGSSLAVADIDGDGKQEIVATTWSGRIYVVEHDGTRKAGFPIALPDVPSCPLDGTEPSGLCSSTKAIVDQGAFGAVVLEDMNKDGKLDIVQTGFDGKVHVYDNEGKPVEGWPVEVHYPGGLAAEPNRGRLMATAAVADFNGDGYPEVIVGSNERLGEGQQSGGVYLIDGRGTKAPSTVLPNWPVTMTSFYLFPLVAEGVPNSPVVGTFDGTRAAVAHGNASSPMLLPLDPGKQSLLNQTPPNVLPQYTDPDTGTVRTGLAPSSTFGELTKAYRPNTMFPLFAQPALGDVDQDGTLDVITAGGSLNLAIQLQGGASASQAPGEHLLAIWSGKTGSMMPAAPFVLEDYSFFNSQAVVDLNNDDYPEVIAGSGAYYLHAWDGCGREPKGWPKFTGQWIIPTPAVGDLDGDGRHEVVTGTRNGWLYAWHTEGKTDGVVEWESYHHDNRNTGNKDVPLEQGTPGRKAARPLTVEVCTELLAEPEDTTPKLEATGGCSCTVGSSSRDNTRLGVLAAAALVGCIARRRRRN